MPMGVESHALVSDGQRLFAIGGWNKATGTRDDVHVLRDGSWTTTEPLPTQLQHHTALVHAGSVFVFGGDDGFGGAVSDAVYRSRITSEGTLEPWTMVATLDTARSMHAMVWLDGRVFLIGGVSSFGNANDATVVDTVVAASLDSEGSLSAFAPVGQLPQSLAWHAAAGVGQQVYVAGGLDDIPPTRLNDAMPVGEVASDGSVTFGPSLTGTALYRLGLVGVDDGLVRIGGATATASTAAVEAAFLDADGNLGSWMPAADLPEASFAHAAVRHGDRLVVSGGFVPGNDFSTRASVWSASLCMHEDPTEGGAPTEGDKGRAPTEGNEKESNRG